MLGDSGGKWCSKGVFIDSVSQHYGQRLYFGQLMTIARKKKIKVIKLRNGII
jgi:hypothetical protein